jgi:phosphopantothenoylcysteine decarboxylase/phosphopantothenate--cysteine ligase
MRTGKRKKSDDIEFPVTGDVPDSEPGQKRGNIKEAVVGVTGSIAAYKACDIVTGLRRAGLRVTVIMTHDACNFITPLTMQTLSNNQVVVDMFAPPTDYNPVHTSITGRADVVLVAPATAHIIGMIANGLANDIVSCAVMATHAPVIICPAMNEQMYKNRIVQQNISKLRKLGYRIVEPAKGWLACGVEGVGRLADVDEILKATIELLKVKDAYPDNRRTDTRAD